MTSLDARAEDPVLAADPGTCNAFLSLSYDPNNPTFNTLGSIDGVMMTFGAGSIANGTKAIVRSVAFDLDCRNKGCSGNPANLNCNVDSDCPGGQFCLALGTTCLDDGDVAGYVGEIASTCEEITWTAAPDPGNPNQIVFVPNPQLEIPANSVPFCNLEFKIVKRSLQSNDTTPLRIEQVARYKDVLCDNGAGSNNAQAGFLSIAPTPTPTATASFTASNTATRSATATATATATSSATASSTATRTSTATATATATWTATVTATATATRTATSTATATRTATATPTATNTPNCGNGIIEPSEQCDPGPDIAGDCCTVDCFREIPGASCTGDGQFCTIDLCDANGMCVHNTNQMNGTVCNDQNLCTENDACTNGMCAGTPLNCNDGIECTDDSCDPATGCVSIAFEESRECANSCFDGINNDQDEDPFIDFEDSGCATLAPFARFGIISTKNKTRRDLFLGSDVTVGTTDADGTCDLGTGHCGCPTLHCDSEGDACNSNADCVDGFCDGSTCACPAIDCSIAGTNCMGDRDCVVSAPGRCNLMTHFCFCPTDAPNCGSRGRPCGNDMDCGVPPLPLGRSVGGVCGNSMLVSAGNQMGVLATRGKVDFGGLISLRPLEMDSEFANANGAVKIAVDAPFVGPMVCSDNLFQLCNLDSQCFGSCVAGTCSDDGVSSCTTDSQCRGTCTVRRRIDDGVCSNNPATNCIINAHCGAGTCEHPFTSSDGQIGAGMAGTGSSLNFKLCDQALILLEPNPSPFAAAPIQKMIEDYVPPPSEHVVLGPTNCRTCPTVNSADGACTPCPANARIAKTNAATKKFIITVGGGLQYVDLQRVAIVGNSILEFRGQDDTILIIRVGRSLRIGGEAKVVLASNNTGNGTLQVTKVLWVAVGRSGGAPNLYRASTFRGTLLASARTGIRLGASVLVEGALWSRKVSVGSASIVQHYPFTELLPEP